MDMVEIDDFLPHVAPKAPSAAIPETLQAVREAARTVCRRLKLWRITDEAEVTAPSYQAIYAPADARILSIETAMLGDRQLEFQEPAWLDREYPGWMFNEPGDARYITQLDPEHIVLHPRQTGTVKLSMLMVPSLDAVNLPAFLLRDYADLVACGAAGMLLATVPNPEFYNAGLGSGLLAKFNADLDRLSAGAARPVIRAPLRTRPRFF